MADRDFGRLRERLLCGGVAPRQVRRIITELQDHHADLVAETIGRGRAPAEAEAEARARLGDEEALVAEVLGRRELRSWVHRWPWAFYGLMPPLIWVVALAPLLCALLVPIGIDVATSGHQGRPTPGWYQVVTAVAQDLSMFALPVVVGAGVCLSAHRRRASLPWPLLGMILVSLLGAALDVQLRWPQAGGHPGSLSIGLSLLPPFPNLGAMLVRTVLSYVLVLGPFLGLRARQQAARAWERT